MCQSHASHFTNIIHLVFAITERGAGTLEIDCLDLMTDPNSSRPSIGTQALGQRSHSHQHPRLTLLLPYHSLRVWLEVSITLLPTTTHSWDIVSLLGLLSLNPSASKLRPTGKGNVMHGCQHSISC